MFNFRCAVCILFFTFSLDKVDLLENGLARTPPMGWMSWGYYMCGTKCEPGDDKCLDESLIMSVADAFYNEGYQEAGYEYIIIDDCWSEMQRDERGRLVADKKRFPRGMKFLGDYIHSKGLKFGMYTNVAPVTCMQYPGSYSYLKKDADTFAEWGVDYLKVDGCFVSEEILNESYIKLGKHLNNTGRPIVFSCSWPYYIQYIINKSPDYVQVAKYCNLWRNFHDIQTTWPSARGVLQYYESNYQLFSKYHGPGHWNDPDMLIIGTGALTHSQSRIQLAVMAMLSAPLLLSCNMKRITPYEKQLLQNMDLIAIAQDPLGIMAEPYDVIPGISSWMKPHLPRKGDLYPSYSFAFVNLNKNDAHGYIDLKRFSFNATDGYTVLDVFTGQYFLNVTPTDRIEVTVKGEDVTLYSLFPL
ncbi:hypothetical protein PYW08_010003 [Mythimna loreyi]|uniref:Uncharacterized protein n=1 Tax=Mythimna loreyi TaxID=667449 RepID=A0ACC2Q710_9NEOP|nr:hypothetical protein PYW08_010003 [Mythimna loreyi]